MPTVTKKPIPKNLKRGLDIVAILTLQTYLVKAHMLTRVYSESQLNVMSIVDLRLLKAHYQSLYNRFIKKIK